MSKAKKTDNGWVLGLIVGLFYLVFTAMTYFKFKKKFNIDSAEVRVQDPLNFKLLIVKFGTSCGVVFLALLFFLDAIFEYVEGKTNDLNLVLFVITITSLTIIVSNFFAIAYASRIATTQIGVLIYKKYDAFVIPCDVYNATFLDQFKLRWFKDMRNMEVLQLSQIVKITRGGHGKMLYIHGTFGTRGVMWRDKRKREECIYALQIACNRKLADSIAYD